MSQIIFLNRYFFPDHSATSQVLSDLAFYLARQGRNVVVVTSRQKYDDSTAELAPFEEVDGVRVHRVGTTRFGRSGTFTRAIDYASFYGPAYWMVLSIASQSDVLVLKTDPPLLSLLGGLAQRSRHLTSINWLQDIYPEVAQQLGVPIIRGPLGSVLKYARDASLRSAYANVVLGARMADRVRAAGVPENRIRIIPNWVDEQSVTPLEHASNPLVKEWGLDGKFVVGYSGNLGRAHEFETILQAAQRLKGDEDVVFLTIGGGHRQKELATRVQHLGLDRSFRFFPYQPDHLLKFSLNVPHVHWISLLPQLEGLIVPSKFYGAAAAGRPTIFIGDHAGELAQTIIREKMGYVVTPGRGDELAGRIKFLKANRAELQVFGYNARQAAERTFSRRQALSAWSELLDSAVNPVAY